MVYRRFESILSGQNDSNASEFNMYVYMYIFYRVSVLERILLYSAHVCTGHLHEDLEFLDLGRIARFKLS